MTPDPTAKGDTATGGRVEVTVGAAEDHTNDSEFESEHAAVSPEAKAADSSALVQTPTKNPLAPASEERRNSKLENSGTGGTRHRGSLAAALDAVEDVADAALEKLGDVWEVVDAAAAPEGVEDEWHVRNSYSDPLWEAGAADAQTIPWVRMAGEILMGIAGASLTTFVFACFFYGRLTPATPEEYDDMNLGDKFYGAARSVLVNNGYPLSIVALNVVWLPYLRSRREQTVVTALKAPFAVVLWQILSWLIWIALDIDLTLAASFISGILLLGIIGRILRKKADVLCSVVALILAVILLCTVVVVGVEFLLRSYDTIPDSLRPPVRLFVQGCASAGFFFGKRSHRTMPATTLPASVGFAVAVGSVGYAGSALLGILLTPLGVIQGGAVSLCASTAWKATSERRCRPKGVHGETERFHFQWSVTNQLDLVMEFSAFCAMSFAVLAYWVVPGARYPGPDVGRVLLSNVIILMQQVLDFSLSSLIMNKCFKTPVNPFLAYSVIRCWMVEEKSRLLVLFMGLGVGPCLFIILVPAAMRVLDKF
eukprot:TRINITY_DN50507_c0_g1_i1.p1 TRINITY_DN50507_c0_g1~~TRINITY_DN50507_c0_g1_i1.p1  ORF type:complete len:539 (+),score=111.41 TRINITY_DN50507_c0_g1_i1:83-1699(+)